MSRQLLSRAGLIGLATGVLGALSALVLLFWPPQIAEGPVSYPFTSTGFLIAQAWFFVHHFGLIVALLALAVSGAIGNGRFARGGARLAIIGMVLLTCTELLAMRYAEWDNDTANAGLMGTSGIASTVVGVGMIVAGVGSCAQASGRDGAGGRRWPSGVTVFAVLTPGMFGGFVMARLAIGFWMLTFAALGWSLIAESRHSSPVVTPRADTPVG